MPVTSCEIHLVRRPDGMPVEAGFSVVEQSVPDAGAGEIQVQNLYLSIDPAMRPRLSAGHEDISMVGSDYQLSDGRRTCGKAGLSVPVGAGMPTVRVSGVTVGGTKA